MSDRIAKNIRHYRKQKNMSQSDLAEKTGLSLMSIRRYETEGNENREPTVQSLEKIANALGVSVCYVNNELVLCELEEIQLSDFDSKDTAELSTIIMTYQKLNDLGKTEAVKRVQELSEIPRYRYNTEE